MDCGDNFVRLEAIARKPLVIDGISGWLILPELLNSEFLLQSLNPLLHPLPTIAHCPAQHV